MTVRPICASFALLLLAFMSATLHAGVTLDSVQPVEGTVGTPLDVQLMGDLGKGKPKMWFTLSDDTAKKPKKTKLKVTTVTDMGGGLSSLATSFKKTNTGAGVYDLHVKPKGKGQVEQVFKAAFTMRDPVVGSIAPDTADPKGVVTITGDFFGGPGKPRVILIPNAGGKSRKAKVQQVVGGNSLVVKLPKLKAGTYAVVVANKLGLGLLAGNLTITGDRGDPPPRDQIISMNLASSQQPLLANQFVAEGIPQGGPGSFVLAFKNSNQFGSITAITALMLVNFQSIGLSMSFPFNPGVTPTPFTIQMGDDGAFFSFGVNQSQPEATWNDDGMIPGSLTVTSATATHMRGTFNFTLVPGGSSPAASDLEMTQGMFDVDVSQVK